MRTEQQRRQQRLQEGVGGSAGDAQRRRQRRLAQGSLRDERMEADADDLRGEVVHRRLLGQAGDVFEVEPVL